MSRYLLALLAFLFSSNQLFSEDQADQVDPITAYVSEGAIPSLVNLTALPTSIVNGSVNVISGDFCEVEQDDIVSGGPDPYILGHSYFSSSLEEGNLGSGWNFAHAQRMEVFSTIRIDTIKGLGGPCLLSLEQFQNQIVCEGDKNSLCQSLPPVPFMDKNEPVDAEDAEEDKLFVEDDENEEDMPEEGELEDDEDNAIIEDNDIVDGEEIVIKGEGGAKRQDKNSHVDEGKPQKPRKPSLDGKPLYLSLYEPSGGRLLFKTTYDKKHKEHSMRHFKLVTKKTGFTNTSGNAISGQTNVKNISLEWDSHHDTFHVTYGDGTRRVYENPEKQASSQYLHYRLHKEVKPDGNIVVYHYNTHHEIKEIVTYNEDLHRLNEITFEQKSTGAFAKDHSLHVTTSDKREHVYYFKRLEGSHKHGTYAVSGIKRPGRPYVRYEYHHDGHHNQGRVWKKESNDGSYLETKYYHAGSNKMGDGEKVKVKDKKHRRLLKHRVRSQYGPMGPKGTRIRTHMYRYFKDSNGGGHCKVYDANNNITRYFWNRHNRLIYIKKSTQKDKVLMREKYIWGKTGTGHEGRLRARILLDEEDHPVLARYFRYDSKGNVFEEQVYGRIKNIDGYLHIKDHKPHNYSCDKLVTEYRHSDDKFNLKVKETDPYDNETRYEYYNGTNLLKAKYICEGKAIKKREFFAYDTNAIMVEQIVDDGTTDDKHDLSDVTERHITYIKPRTERPHFGEPEVIEQYCYDFSKNKEVLLNKTVNEFSKKGFIEKKKVYDQAGNHVSYEYLYDDVGRVLFSKDPEGNEEHFTYNKHGRLKTKRGPRQEVTWTYFYNKMGRLYKEVEKQKNGPELSTKYLYDKLGRKRAVIDSQGHATRYEYDGMNRVTKITYPVTYDHEGKKLVPQKSYTYEKLGMKVTEEDQNGHKTVTCYNILGKVLTRKLPDGTTYEYTYDLKGNPVEEKAPNGSVTKMQYDAFNRVLSSKIAHGHKTLSERTLTYNSFHLISEVGPSGETITYTYDYAGRKVMQTQQGMRNSTYYYDAQSRLAKELTLLGEKEFIGKGYTYDKLGRLVYEKLYDDSHDVCTYQSYGYDQEGNRNSIIKNIDGQEAIYKTEYYPHGLPKINTDAEGNVTRYLYNYHYVNQHGQEVVSRDTIDARGCIDKEVFDTCHNLSSATRFDSSGMTIAKKELFYDAANNLVRVHEHVFYNGYEEKMIVTLMSYGPLNRLKSITEAAGTPEEKVTRYKYNEYGQKESIIYSDGTTLHHSYDHKGRLERYDSSDKTIDYIYKYDPSDRILEVKNGLTHKKTSRRYNVFGEINVEMLENGLIINYSYDDAGRVQELTLPDDSKVDYNYSQAFLVSIKRFDAEGKQLFEHKILERDLSGHIQKAALLGDAGTIAYNHDKLGRCTKIAHDSFVQEVPKHGFDPVGNLLSLHTKDPQGETERTFTYDFLSQLTEEKGPTEHSYSYDSLYNRRLLDDDAYSVNSLHSVLSDSHRSFTYDARGNRLTMTDDGQTTKYVYDALDRLITVQTPDTSYEYQYDAFNRRIKKSCAATKEETKYLYALENEIGATDAKGKITELRVLGEGLGAEIGAAVAIELGDKFYAPLHDLQGNVTVLVDPSGKVVQSYRYDAFGNETIVGKDVPNPWRFSSKRVDPETGLVYFGRRYYDPSLGKWLTQDPLGLKAGPNLYAYVMNNPMTKFDLYGLDAVQIENMNQLGDNSSEENSYREDNRESCESDASDSSSVGLDRTESSSGISSGSERNESSAGSIVSNFLQSQTFKDGLDDLDKLSLAIMLVPVPTVQLAGLGLKIFCTGLRLVKLIAKAAPAAAKLAGKVTAGTKALSATTSVAEKVITNNAKQSAQATRKTADFVLSKVKVNGVEVEGLVDVKSTLERIQKGVKHPHKRDGTIFHNDKNRLPTHLDGYYTEHVLPSPGVNHAGPQRIVKGKNGELYYTSDHYQTFATLN